MTLATNWRATEGPILDPEGLQGWDLDATVEGVADDGRRRVLRPRFCQGGGRVVIQKFQGNLEEEEGAVVR